MADKEKKPQWFKIWGMSYPTISAIDSETVGDALKAALKFFVSGAEDKSGFEELESDGIARIALSVFVNAAEDAFKDYQESVENGRKGSEVKKQKMLEEEKKKWEQERKTVKENDYPGDDLPF